MNFNPNATMIPHFEDEFWNSEIKELEKRKAGLKGIINYYSSSAKRNQISPNLCRQPNPQRRYKSPNCQIVSLLKPDLPEELQAFQGK
mmetsp:Transcript_32182/g.31594  ORF Transcript_32182/g.31594 Transcript_32182/m.31594 type:complete len:88 (+) Transcript_32182:536-799(+)